MNNYRRADGDYAKVREQGEERLCEATMTGFPYTPNHRSQKLREHPGSVNTQIPTPRPNIQTENYGNQRQL